MGGISRRKIGKTYAMTISLKEALKNGNEVVVLTREKDSASILKRLDFVGMKAKAEPMYRTDLNRPIFDLDGGIIGYKKSVTKQIGFKITKVENG